MAGDLYGARAGEFRVGGFGGRDGDEPAVRSVGNKPQQWLQVVASVPGEWTCRFARSFAGAATPWARNAGGSDGVADGVAPAAAPLGSAQVTGAARAGASAVGGTSGQHDRRLAPAPWTQPATLESQAPASWRGRARGSSRRAQCGVVRRLQGPFPHPRRGALRSADHLRRAQPLPDRLSPREALHRWLC